jgi:hypothetical protein
VTIAFGESDRDAVLGVGDPYGDEGAANWTVASAVLARSLRPAGDRAAFGECEAVDR